MTMSSDFQMENDGNGMVQRWKSPAVQASVSHKFRIVPHSSIAGSPMDGGGAHGDAPQQLQHLHQHLHQQQQRQRQWQHHAGLQKSMSALQLEKDHLRQLLLSQREKSLYRLTSSNAPSDGVLMKPREVGDRSAFE